MTGQGAAVAPGATEREGLAASASGAVTVRLAKDEADTTAMIDLGRVLRAESRYRILPLDDTRMGKLGRLAERRVQFDTRGKPRKQGGRNVA